MSLKIRAWIETHFGWLKSAAGMRQVKQRGLKKVEALFQLAMAASNLVRLLETHRCRSRRMTVSMGKVRPQWSQEWAKADFRVEFTVCRDCPRA